MSADFHASSSSYIPVGEEQRAMKTNATKPAVGAYSVSASKIDSCQVTNFSIDHRDVTSTIKPVNVGLVKTLFRVFDVFASSFPTTTGKTIPFSQLSQKQKVEVFNATASVPGIKMDQIRLYHHFAMYCWKTILEMESRVTIKQFILDQCTLHFKIVKINVGNINVNQLLQVCFSFFLSFFLSLVPPIIYSRVRIHISFLFFFVNQL